MTFQVHELSSLDRSEEVILAWSSVTVWNILMKLHRYIYHQRLHIVTKVHHSDISNS